MEVVWSDYRIRAEPLCGFLSHSAVLSVAWRSIKHDLHHITHAKHRVPGGVRLLGESVGTCLPLLIHIHCLTPARSASLFLLLSLSRVEFCSGREMFLPFLPRGHTKLSVTIGDSHSGFRLKKYFMSQRLKLWSSTRFPHRSIQGYRGRAKRLGSAGLSLFHFLLLCPLQVSVFRNTGRTSFTKFC